MAYNSVGTPRFFIDNYQYLRAIGLDPKDPESYYWSGVIYYNQNKHLRAINMFTTTITKLKDFGFPHHSTTLTHDQNFKEFHDFSSNIS